MNKVIAGIGVVWAILMIIFGFFLLPYGIVSIGLGIFLIFYIKSESQEISINDK